MSTVTKLGPAYEDDGVIYMEEASRSSAHNTFQNIAFAFASPPQIPRYRRLTFPFQKSPSHTPYPLHLTNVHRGKLDETIGSTSGTLSSLPKRRLRIRHLVLTSPYRRKLYDTTRSTPKTLSSLPNDDNFDCSFSAIKTALPPP
ncbi:MAG: hypothetical protein Q9173_002282 [Seirophora scorigena]